MYIFNSQVFLQKEHITQTYIKEDRRCIIVKTCFQTIKNKFNKYSIFKILL